MDAALFVNGIKSVSFYEIQEKIKDEYVAFDIAYDTIVFLRLIEDPSFLKEFCKKNSTRIKDAPVYSRLLYSGLELLNTVFPGVVIAAVNDLKLNDLHSTLVDFSKEKENGFAIYIS